MGSIYISGGSLVATALNTQHSASSFATPITDLSVSNFNINLTGELNYSGNTGSKIYGSSVISPGMNINITANNATFSDTQILSQGGAYNGGNINIRTIGSLTLTNVYAASDAVGNLANMPPSIYDAAHPGDAGSVNLNVGGLLTMTNSSIYAGTNQAGGLTGGKAGAISIDAGSIQMAGGYIAADAVNSVAQKAGTVVVTSRGDIRITGVAGTGQRVNAWSQAGDGGSVSVTAGGEVNLSGLDINAGTAGLGAAGDVSISARNLFISDVYLAAQTRSETASGGSISLRATGDMSLTGSVLPTASWALGHRLINRIQILADASFTRARKFSACFS